MRPEVEQSSLRGCPVASYALLLGRIISELYANNYPAPKVRALLFLGELAYNGVKYEKEGNCKIEFGDEKIG